MPADPVAAGRKGGKSKSAAKLAAARRNGFQKVRDAVLAAQPECALCPNPEKPDAPAPKE